MTEDRPRPEPELVLRDVGDELMFYERNEDRIHILNGTARAIFQLCDGRRSLEEIAGELVVRFDVDRDSARRDVRDTVERLRDLGILQHR